MGTSSGSPSAGIEKAATLQRSGSTIYFASVTFTNVASKQNSTTLLLQN